MAYKTNNNTAAPKVTLDLSTFKDLKVENVRVINDTTIGFSLSAEGIKLRNLRVLNTAKGEFISMPSEKDKNGNYWPIFSLYLKDEDQKTIIGMVKAVGGIQ